MSLQSTRLGTFEERAARLFAEQQVPEIDVPGLLYTPPTDEERRWVQRDIFVPEARYPVVALTRSDHTASASALYVTGLRDPVLDPLHVLAALDAGNVVTTPVRALLFFPATAPVKFHEELSMSLYPLTSYERRQLPRSYNDWQPWVWVTPAMIKYLNKAASSYIRGVKCQLRHQTVTTWSCTLGHITYVPSPTSRPLNEIAGSPRTG